MHFLEFLYKRKADMYIRWYEQPVCGDENDKMTDNYVGPDSSTGRAEGLCNGHDWEVGSSSPGSDCEISQLW